MTEGVCHADPCRALALIDEEALRHLINADNVNGVDDVLEPETYRQLREAFAIESAGIDASAPEEAALARGACSSALRECSQMCAE